MSARCLEFSLISKLLSPPYLPAALCLVSLFCKTPEAPTSDHRTNKHFTAIKNQSRSQSEVVESVRTDTRCETQYRLKLMHQIDHHEVPRQLNCRPVLASPREFFSQRVCIRSIHVTFAIQVVMGEKCRCSMAASPMMPKIQVTNVRQLGLLNTASFSHCLSLYILYFLTRAG